MFLTDRCSVGFQGNSLRHFHPIASASVNRECRLPLAVFIDQRQRSKQGIAVYQLVYTLIILERNRLCGEIFRIAGRKDFCQPCNVGLFRIQRGRQLLGCRKDIAVFSLFDIVHNRLDLHFRHIRFIGGKLFFCTAHTHSSKEEYDHTDNQRKEQRCQRPDAASAFSCHITHPPLQE